MFFDDSLRSFSYRLRDNWGAVFFFSDYVGFVPWQQKRSRGGKILMSYSKGKIVILDCQPGRQINLEKQQNSNEELVRFNLRLVQFLNGTIFFYIIWSVPRTGDMATETAVYEFTVGWFLWFPVRWKDRKS